jgi:NitT/TauT family transport system permease protein
LATFRPALTGFTDLRIFTRRYTPNVFDIVIFALVFGLLALVAIGGQQTLKPLTPPNVFITLDPWVLPNYALRTMLRMFAAMGLSVLCTFVFGPWAAKSRRVEMVIVPFIDVMQSVPPLAFLPLTLAFFLGLAPGQIFGAELASIFLVFTSQAWNMVFAMYHACRTIPRDLKDLSDSMRLGAWRRFWALEAPFAAPSLIWNAMMSMAGSWFFVVASEAFSVGNTNIALPGVGSYVALAVEKHDFVAIGWAVLTMLIVILATDQLVFRPLVAWSEKFKVDSQQSDEPATSWVLDLLQRADLSRRMFRPLGHFLSSLASIRLGRPIAAPAVVARALSSRSIDYIYYVMLGLLGLVAGWRAVSYIGATVGWHEVGWAAWLGAITLFRVFILVLIASVIWVPIGVWIGLRPRLASIAQPIAQILAAFPVNLFFGVVVAGIVAFHLVPDIWLSPLMILGTQWYILFNVVAGASIFPGDLLEAAASLRVKGWAWWRKVILPGIFPAYVTGAITAVGGSWNASVLAEVAEWGQTKVEAHGLGAYIADASAKADLHRVLLGTVVMAVYVVLFNRLFWEPVFAWGAKRLRAE